MKPVIERRILSLTAFLSVLVAAGGCGSGAVTAFGSRFPDNDPARTTGVFRALPPPAPARRPDNALGRPVVLAASLSDRPEIIVYDIEMGRTLWRRALQAASRPQLLGDLVVTAVGGEVAAFALATGKPRFRSPLAGRIFLGAARWNEILVHVSGDAAFGRGRSRSYIAALDACTGARLWRHEVGGRLGKPEAAAGMVFVPWDLQYLVVLDARSGAELARLRSTDDVISWVNAGPSGVYFGQGSIYRLTGRGYAGERKGAPVLSAALPEIPGLPALQESAYTFKPAERSAEGRIRFFFAPAAAPGDAIRMLDDRLYLVFYRYVFAFDPAGGLVWSRLLESELIGGQPVSGGLIVVSESGEVELLGAGEGRTLLRTRLPAALASAEVDARGVKAVEGAGRGGAAPAEFTLRTELGRIALDPDNRLLAARIFAVAQLARLPDPVVTRDLLEIYEQGPLPDRLKDAIAGALAGRRSGGSYLLQALGRHYDFLRGTRVPPLQVIVPALVRMGEEKAVPLLVGHLFEPETPLEVLPELVAAIDRLGDSMVAEPLLDFVSRYRADSSFAGAPQALVKAAEAVLRRGDSRHRERLLLIASEPGTHTLLAESIARPVASGRQEGKRDEQPAASRSARVPDRIGQSAIDEVFSRHVDEIRACIVEELGRNPRLARVRIAFVLENDGRASDFRFSPRSPGLVECLAPRVKRYRFPRFRAVRQLGSYTVTLRAEAGEKQTEKTEPPPGPAEPEKWWLSGLRASRQTAAAGEEPGRKPWWYNALPHPAPEPGVAGGARPDAGKARGQAGEGGAGEKPAGGPAARRPDAAEDAWWLPEE